MSKQDKYRAAGAGRSGKNKKGVVRKAQSWEKLFYALLTCVNLLLSVVVAVTNRREVIHAVQEDEDIRLLLTEKAKTEKL